MVFLILQTKKYVLAEKLITDEDDFIRISISPGAYEIEALKNEMKKINVEKVYLTNEDSPFTMKPNFSTLGSIIENFSQGPITSFASDDSIRTLLGFQETILYEEYYLSPNPVDILSFDNVFLECDIAKRMLFKGRRSNINHNWTMTVDPGYKHVENFAGGISWYMTESKDVISSISFKLKNEDGQLVSFNGQSMSFRLSIKEIYEMDTYKCMSTYTGVYLQFFKYLY